jgi:tetratricopeptide (TPR) repeat protein
MRMRTLNRAVILAMFAISGCASRKHPSSTTMPMASTLPPATEPTTQSVATTQHVATKPLTYPVTRPVVIVPPTQPASQPATQMAVEEPNAFHPAPPTTNPAELEADAALAERVAALGQSAVPMKVPSNDLWDPIMHQQAAMLLASNKLDPTNARLARLTLEAMLHMHDEKGTIAALNAIRKVDPADQFAQVQLIDLYANRMETADAKVAYFRDLLGRVTTIPATVRAHAAVLCAKFMLERGEEQSAEKLLNQAIVLNPVSGEALRLHYDMLPQNTSSFERVEGLLAILKSNPAQAAYASRLADQLAANGLVEDAIPWYRAALSLSAAAGQPDLNAARNCATLMLLDDQVGEAAAVSNQLVKVEPENPDNWFLELAVFRYGGSKDDYAKAVQMAGNVMSNRLVEVVNSIGAPGSEKATTRPINSDGPIALPDLALTVAQLNQKGTADQKAMFVQAISDLAMVEVYFAQQGDAASRLLDALSAILPTDSPQVVRLSGWADLVSGRANQARTKLSSIASKDPLAELGLIKLTAANPADQRKAGNMGRQLISQHPSGLLAAIIWDGLKGLDSRIVTSGQADLIKEQMDAFPKILLKVIDQPQGFYGVHVEPVNVARQFGEPLLATLRIQNLTDNDLTIGPDGIVARGLWFSALIHGGTDQTIGGVAYEQLAGPLVLGARQHMQQTIRLDQGPLLGLLNSDPTISMEVYGTVATNPMAGANGTLVPGPAGYAVQFSSVFSRKAAPPDGPEALQAATDLDGGTPVQKLRAINLLAKYVEIVATNKDANDQAKQFEASCYQAIAKARNDSSPAVSAWAQYVIGSMSNPQGKATILRDMAEDPDWLHRLFSLLLANSVDLTLHKEIATTLSVDPEPCVRDFAKAALDLVDIASKLPPPTTESSTTQP